ncbi:MAG TPA: NAD(P)H-hydrate dehydratase [Verrucomicrobiota bacterium]|nr:NAD(P)H-hydrate dehydratase [Verrucomicrobiota bacterium]
MPVPVVTIAQMRQWEEATWATGRTQQQVIGLVGSRVAREAMTLTRRDDAILILAGKGHNGDDARAAASCLSERYAEVLNVQDPESSLSAVSATLARKPALIIDGLFGIGLSRPLDAAWQAIISAINESGIRVLSVDVPSGLNADTGEALGKAVNADVTLTLAAPKPGLLLTKAEKHVGRLIVEPDIGLVQCPIQSDQLWVLPDDFYGYPPRRPVGAHKGHFGHLVIIAGSLGYHGAGVLAARAAQRAQPGLISIYTVPPAYVPVASQLQAVMVHPWMVGQRFPDRTTAVLAGPGLAASDLPSDVKNAVVTLWRESEMPMIVDASALDWLSHGQVRKDAIRVITPHPGEAARLLGASVDSVQSDRPAALRELSRRYGECWVVLKGRHTLIGRHEGPILINSSGNSHLAQGGSGDVLAGYAAGLLAQPALQREVQRTLAYAVCQHGAAADLLTATRRNWVIEDLLDQIGNIALRNFASN